MSTQIKIPGHFLQGKLVDINALLAGLPFPATVLFRELSNTEWVITIAENLNAGEQVVVENTLLDAFNKITFVVT